MRLGILWAAAMSAAMSGCADGADSSQPASSTSTGGAAGAPGGSGGAGGGGAAGSGQGGSMAPAASWSIDSNLSLNGHDFDKDARSAVARPWQTGTTEEVDVEVTSAPEYCALLQDEGCIADGEFLLTFLVHGTAPGTYAVSAGEADVFMIAVDNHQCTGAGLGADEGSVVLSTVNLEAGGAVVMTADVSFFGGAYLKAKITAPACEAPQ